MPFHYWCGLHCIWPVWYISCNASVSVTQCLELLMCLKCCCYEILFPHVFSFLEEKITIILWTVSKTVQKSALNSKHLYKWQGRYVRMTFSTRFILCILLKLYLILYCLTSVHNLCCIVGTHSTLFRYTPYIHLPWEIWLAKSRFHIYAWGRGYQSSSNEIACYNKILFNLNDVESVVKYGWDKAHDQLPG